MTSTSCSIHESSIGTTHDVTKDIQGRFGLARFEDDICLVQLISSSTPQTYQAHIFRHNFISIFSFSHTDAIDSALVEVLEDEGENAAPKCWLEEETQKVFVAPDVMARYIWLKDRIMLSRAATMRRTMATRRSRLSQPAKGVNHRSRSCLAS